MTLPSRLRFLWLTLAVVLLDRATKAWFESQTTEGWRHEVIHHFIYLVRASNPGIAFSFFDDWFGSYHYPAFNVADSAITIGAILILLEVLFPPRVQSSQSVKS